MFNRRPLWIAPWIILLLALPGFSQRKDKYKAPSFDGTTGLFRTWEADTLRQFELNAGVGYSMFHRDPGRLRLQTLPIGFAFGVHDRFEVFGSIEAMHRVEADNIRAYRLLPDRLPMPAWSPMGAARFSNEAPFMDVPDATDLGPLRLGAKFSLFSERRRDFLSASVVGFVKVPTANSRTELNRGLGTGEIDGGYGIVLSKIVGRYARLHVNALLNWVGDPEMDGIILAELQNEFIYRAGADFPSYGKFRIIAEANGKLYFGARTLGLNPRDPLDLIFGVRVYPAEWVSFGAGYLASLNHIQDDPGRQIFGADTNGLVAQFSIGRRINRPPVVTCAAADSTIVQDDSTIVRANAVDPEDDDLTYSWTATGGEITGRGETVTYHATGVPPGEYTVTVTVSDYKHDVNCSIGITVLKKNLPPVVSCHPATATIQMGGSVTIRATASDPNNDSLTYSWRIGGSEVAAVGPALTFGSEGRRPGTYEVEATVSDGELTARCTSTVEVLPKPNTPPTIECMDSPVIVKSGETVSLRARASDPDGDSLRIAWTATGGSVTGSGESVTFDASGLRAGIYTVIAEADDGRGGRASCSIAVTVREVITLDGFAPGSERLNNIMKAALDDIAIRMQNDPRLQANIIGYTDGSQRETSMEGLGARRAQSAADYLIQKGIDSSRIRVIDGGADNPVGDNSTEEGRKMNRRIEIELIPR